MFRDKENKEQAEPGAFSFSFLLTSVKRISAYVLLKCVVKTIVNILLKIIRDTLLLLPGSYKSDKSVCNEIS